MQALKASIRKAIKEHFRRPIQKFEVQEIEIFSKSKKKRKEIQSKKKSGQ